MKDTIVGVLGALVIVGSLAGAISMLEEEELETETPAAFDQSRWDGDDCRTLTMVWNVDADQLAEHVDPWTPRTDPIGDGEFRLVAWECGENTLNNTDVGDQSGAFAMVLIEEPEDTRNVTRDEWRALPEAIGDTGDGIAGAFDRHGFQATEGTSSFEELDAMAALDMETTISTEDGQIDVSTTFLESPESFEEDDATVAPGNETFSAATGTTEGDQRSAATATVEASGETWVSELGLSEEPDQTLYQTGVSFSLSLFDLPFDAVPPDEQETDGTE